MTLGTIKHCTITLNGSDCAVDVVMTKLPPIYYSKVGGLNFTWQPARGSAEASRHAQTFRRLTKYLYRLKRRQGFARRCGFI